MDYRDYYFFNGPEYHWSDNLGDDDQRSIEEQIESCIEHFPRFSKEFRFSFFEPFIDELLGPATAVDIALEGINDGQLKKCYDLWSENIFNGLRKGTADLFTISNEVDLITRAMIDEDVCPF
jgi:hypothetical protein